MSLIVEALQKTETPTPVRQRPQKKPWWVTAALSAGCAIVLWNLGHEISARWLAWTPSRSALQPSTENAVPETPSTVLSLTNILKVAIPTFGQNMLRSAESTWHLNGVIQGDGKPLALINGKVVEEGTSVGGAKVVRISENEVDLETDGRRRTLRLE